MQTAAARTETYTLLAAKVQTALTDDPFSGHVFAFRGRPNNRIDDLLPWVVAAYWSAFATGLLLVAMVLTAFAAPVSAQENNNLLPETMLRRYGLKRAWFAQVQLDGSRGKLTFLSQHISQARAYTVFEVSYDDKVIPFSEREIDRFGEMVGKERAQKMAEEKMQLLVRSLKKPKLATKVYPDITLVAQTDRGVLHVLDGETGRTRWVVSIGDPRHPPVLLVTGLGIVPAVSRTVTMDAKAAGNVLVVVGARTVGQLQAALASEELELPGPVREALDDVSA